MLGLVLPLTVLLAANSTGLDKLITRVESAPKDVEAFIVRRAGCNHFLSEPSFNRERAAFLDRMVEELRCHELARDEETLRRTHQSDAVVLRLLDETVDMGPW